jgi:hypothetical protein
MANVEWTSRVSFFLVRFTLPCKDKRFTLGMEEWTNSPSKSPLSRSPTPLTRKRQRNSKAKGTKGKQVVRGAATPSPKRKRLNLSLPKRPSDRWVFLDECAAGALEKKYVLMSCTFHRIQHKTIYSFANCQVQWKHTYPASTRYSCVCLEWCYKSAIKDLLK